jgi:hypothetical protein
VQEIRKGIVAGAVAALSVSALLQLNADLGLFPQLDWTGLFAADAGNRAAGWLLFASVGALCGALFAWADPDLPGDNLRQRGVAFAAGLWILHMLVILPLAGAGFMGLRHGIALPLATFVVCVIFGAVMGTAYAWLFLQSLRRRYRYEPPLVAPRRAPATERIEIAVRAAASAAPAPTAEVIELRPKAPAPKPRRTKPRKPARAAAPQA